MLPDQEAKEYFARRGLPLTEVVLARAGYPGWVDNKWCSRIATCRTSPTSFTTAIGCSSDGLRNLLDLFGGASLLLAALAMAQPQSIRHAEMPDDQYSVLDLFSNPVPARPIRRYALSALGIWGYPVDAAPYPGWLRDFLLAPLGWLVVLSYLAVAGSITCGT